MTTKIIQLKPVTGESSEIAICPVNNTSNTCSYNSQVSFVLPRAIQEQPQCCGYVELYIYPAPPESRVIISINDMELSYQQCPIIQSDGSSVGVVKMLTDEGPMFFSPYTIPPRLTIFDPTTQISTSGYRASAKVVCYPKKNCDKLDNREQKITLYAVGPCTKNKTTGSIICPDGYCVSRVLSQDPRSGGLSPESSQSHVHCPCTPKKYVDCSKRCHANSTCVIENNKPGLIQYGTCSGCSKIGCVFTGAGI